jgi:hypothetical protein
MCGAVRPYDGPHLIDRDRFVYSVGAFQLEANEAADWEALEEWPAWNSVDADGVQFFVLAGTDTGPQPKE